MGVKPNWHVRSLRMPQEEADAIAEAAARLRISASQFIRQSCRHVLRQAGVAIAEPAEDEQLEDPFE